MAESEGEPLLTDAAVSAVPIGESTAFLYHSCRLMDLLQSICEAN